jgi:integrase
VVGSRDRVVCRRRAPHALTPMMIALYTGQRRADCRTMSWQQWQGDLVRVRTAKTHQLIDMPCHPAEAPFSRRCGSGCAA